MRIRVLLAWIAGAAMLGSVALAHAQVVTVAPVDRPSSTLIYTPSTSEFDANTVAEAKVTAYEPR